MRRDERRGLAARGVDRERAAMNDAGDEAAVRLGEVETLSQFSAGQYPGVGNRTQANDGHFVNAVITQIAARASRHR